MNVTEYGDFMPFGSPAILDEWGRRKIDALLEDGTKLVVVGILPPSGDFPPEYIPEGKAADLRPRAPAEATVTKVSQDFPLLLGRVGKSKELKSKVE